MVSGTYTPIIPGQDVQFIATLNLVSGAASLINSADYTAARMCASDDGTVWTLGQKWTELLHITIALPLDYGMVRNYRLDGTLQRSALMRSSLGIGALDLRPDGKTFGMAVNHAKLSWGDQSVGVFIGTPVSTWTEFNTGTGTTQQWHLSTLLHSQITGLVLFSANTVYASFVDAPARSLYKLNLAGNLVGNWAPVADGASSNPFATVVGRDGPALVHLRGTQRPAMNPVLYWSAP